MVPSGKRLGLLLVSVTVPPQPSTAVAVPMFGFTHAEMMMSGGTVSTGGFVSTTVTSIVSVAVAPLAAVTRSEKGCVVVSKAGVIEVPAAPIKEFVDATGAGDLFAAGFLFGLARGRDHKTAAQLGGLAAAEVIQHIGARPEVSLKDLAKQNGHPV